MNRERLFLDTAFIQALLNRRDKYHEQATALLQRVRNAAEVWITEAVMWGLTDCVSFVVMQERGLTDAATADEHFTQAGYRALLLGK